MAVLRGGRVDPDAAARAFQHTSFPDDIVFLGQFGTDGIRDSFRVLRLEDHFQIVLRRRGIVVLRDKAFVNRLVLPDKALIVIVHFEPDRFVPHMLVPDRFLHAFQDDHAFEALAVLSLRPVVLSRLRGRFFSGGGREFDHIRRDQFRRFRLILLFAAAAAEHHQQEGCRRDHRKNFRKFLHRQLTSFIVRTVIKRRTRPSRSRLLTVYIRYRSR